MHARLLFGAAIAAAALTTTPAPASASLITISGVLDASQVVAPVFDANGNVIGSTSTINGQPVSTSTATGFATVTFDTVLLTITTDLSWSGLSGNPDRAHLHDAPFAETRLVPPNNRFFHEVISDTSVDGGLVTCGGDPTDPTWFVDGSCAPSSGSLHDVLNLDPAVNPGAIFYFAPYGFEATGFADFAELVSVAMLDGLFLDIHTELYPGGEIRGQLLFHQVPEPAGLVLLSLSLAVLCVWARPMRRTV